MNPIQKHVVYYAMLFVLLGNAFLQQFNDMPKSVLEVVKFLITAAAISAAYLSKGSPDDPPTPPVPGPAGS